MNIDTRLSRMETMLCKVLHKLPPATPKRLPQKMVCELYRVSPSRLKQLRLGWKRGPKIYPPLLFKWAHDRFGNKIDYDVEELDRYFKRTIAGTEQVIKPYTINKTTSV